MKEGGCAIRQIPNMCQTSVPGHILLSAYLPAQHTVRDRQGWRKYWECRSNSQYPGHKKSAAGDAALEITTKGGWCILTLQQGGGGGEENQYVRII